MKLWITDVPKDKLAAVKAIRLHAVVGLRDAARAYEQVVAGSPYELTVTHAADALREEGFTIVESELSPPSPAPEPPVEETPPDTKAYQALSVLMGMTEGNVVKVAMAAKLLGRCDSPEFWDDVFKALSETFNTSFES